MPFAFLQRPSVSKFPIFPGALPVALPLRFTAKAAPAHLIRTVQNAVQRLILPNRRIPVV